jgi:hypothetical protein
MLVMSKGALSLGQAETYYDEKYARDDYYSEDRTVAGEWFGIAAAALGLTGTAARPDFSAVLRGHDPRTGAELVAKAQDREERRAGWDATFSAPKSVSIQALVGRRSATNRSPPRLRHGGARRGRDLCAGAPPSRTGVGHHR